MQDQSAPPNKRATMKDVARRAGVSQSTVSFVLNATADVRIADATRTRVLRAAREIGYRPRSAGRPASTDTLSVIGVMFDEISTSPFAAISVDGMRDRAWAQGRLIEFVTTGGDREYERATLRKWTADRVEGVVFASILTREAAPPEGLGRHRVVMMNCYDARGKFPSIVPAERRGGAAATRALIAAGHRPVAMIAGEPWMEAAKQRREGFVSVCQEARLAPEDSVVVEGNFMASGGRSATLELMARRRPPRAIFCANDGTAVGCYEALKELGLVVGRDVAVMGYDDHEVAQQLDPPLSSVLLPHREMGQMAIDAIMGADPIPPRQVRVECPLVLRNSHL